MMSSNSLLVIVGPTAVGKTTLAVSLAKRLNTEIISADSRQLYQELSIGTAKPTEEEMQNIPHHFINSHSITDTYSVGDYERDCLKLLDDLFLQQNVVILVGGSGLFVRALLEGLDEFPEVPPQIREDLIHEFQSKGITFLQEKITELDPEYAKAVDLQNHQRLIRALEVCLASGKPYSSFRTASKKQRSFNTIKVGLELDRPILYDRINTRVDNMIKQGLIEEARSVLEYKGHNALQTVGYQELFDHFAGKTSEVEAIELIKRNSRRFAKRQLTWFKKDEETKWFNPQREEEISRYFESKTNNDDR